MNKKQVGRRPFFDRRLGKRRRATNMENSIRPIDCPKCGNQILPEVEDRAISKQADSTLRALSAKGAKGESRFTLTLGSDK